MNSSCATVKPRLDYIDAMRGFAIFLVVFAHVIAWSYTDFDSFMQSASDSWLFRLIYSFHMPLFFFVSGYLGYRSISSRSVMDVIKRRTWQILLPYVAATVFVTFVLRQEMNYWYLIALYWMSIVTAVTSKCKYKCAPLIVWALVYSITIFLPQLNTLPYVFIPSFKTHFINFMLGYFFAMYPNVEKRVGEKFYKYSLFVFLCLYLFQLSCLASNNTMLRNVIGGGKIELLYNYLKAFAAIIFFFNLFKNMSFTGKYRIWLRNIGKLTLEIYVFHVMFKFAIPKLGDAMSVWGISFPVLVQFVFALLMTVVLIEISILIGKTLRKDRILSVLFLGAK